MDIANSIGVSRDAISKYERGDIVPSVENAKKIADTLHVSLDYLVSEQEQQEAIDNKMVNRIKELQKLSEAYQNCIISVIDSFVRDAKTKQAYS